LRVAATATPQPQPDKPSQDVRHDANLDRIAILFLAYTGVRFGELAAIRAGQVDLDRRRARIAQSVTAVNGALVWGTPKGHAQRWVSFPEFVAADLTVLVGTRAANELVFVSPNGDPLRASSFRRDVFTPAATRAGLPGLVPHELRHTAASLAIAAGADVKVVQQMLGHKSATLTLDLYGHLFDDRLGEVADALNRAAEAAGQTSAVAPLLPEQQVIDLAQRRRARKSPGTRDLREVPPTGFEPVTPGLGDQTDE
jgi:integrase